MRATSGAHFIALDHVRALAAFMVFTWHFVHGGNGYPVPMGYAPVIFPFALLDEGHSGVALFMTLSGYLFAKLLDGKSVNYAIFLWNRMLRLLPLLTVALLIYGIRAVHGGMSLSTLSASIVEGTVLPTLPNGAWSLTVEFHYYAILPLFLWMIRKSRWLPLSIVAAAIMLRISIYHYQGNIQYLAYWTIIGRVDQFALGMLAFHFRTAFCRQHMLVATILLLFSTFYWYLDLRGGSFGGPEWLWIFLPTIEGLAYAIGISWYDASFSHSTSGFSRFAGRIGEYSYSIYLLHVFFVFNAANFVNTRIMDLSNFYVACLWSAACFLVMMPIGYVSFRFIEAPFLGLRRAYVISVSRDQEASAQVGQQQGTAVDALGCTSKS